MRNIFSLKEYLFTYVIMNIALSNLRFIGIIFVVLACNNSYSQIVTKQLYLSDSSQSLDIIDPLETNNLSTVTSPVLTTGSLFTFDLTATSSAKTINRYADSTGGSTFGTGTNFTTLSISATIIYSLDTKVNSYTKTSRKAETATVLNNYWNGVNTDWNDPANWFLGVPTEGVANTLDVVIPSGLSNYPIIFAGTPAGYVKTLVLESNTTLNIRENSFRVTDNLKLDGKIDLEGASQLLQDTGSLLDPTSSGTLEIDQQGNKDLYTYTYWSSPVGLSNNTTNNNSFKLTDNVLRNGTLASAPNNITFLTSGYNGSVSGTNISIADYWVWKYTNNTSNSYSAWQHVRRTGTILAGEGFTMKGVESSGTSFTSTQNYNFHGKPNNGDITLLATAENDYLVGNPYPSAIDADEFILDNTISSGGRAASNIINGTLYFWDHFANSTHALKAYEGGYATYSRLGGLPAISTDIGINSSSAIGSKVPRRYIPVGQGFFVVADSGGIITFKNSQRVFKTKAVNPSISIKAKLSETNVDIRQKIRLKFDSPNGYHRLILAGVDENASNAFDIGYDAPLIENNAEDMFWVSETNDKYIIQAVNNFDTSQVLPLGIKTNKAGLVTIKLDFLENIADNKIIFVHDKELNILYNLKNSSYQVYLNPGTYLNRFEIVFSNTSNLALGVEDIAEKSLQVYFSNEKESIVIHNPDVKNIESTEIFNLLGQSIYRFDSISKENYMEYKTKHLIPGTYIIKLKTDSCMVSKKVLIK